MTPAWSSIAWDEGALNQALPALASSGCLRAHASTLASVSPEARASVSTIDAWILAAADQLGVEAAPIDCGYLELGAVLASLAPGLIRITQPEGRRYLAVERSTQRHLELITPTLAKARVGIEHVRECLTREHEALPEKRVAYLLSIAGINARRARRARNELLGLYLSETRIADMWLLRMDPGASFATQLRNKGVLRRATLSLALCLGQVIATLCGWVILGRSALAGVVEPGWLIAWLLSCLSALPLQIATIWLGGRLLNDTAALLKQRLLCGALRIDPDRIRLRGSGRLLAMVSESEAIEGAGLTGAFGAALSCVQLASAGVIIAFGAGGPFQLALLLAWCAFVALVFRRTWRRRAAWTDHRFELANSFVENVVGNRTRIVQQPQDHWHVLDDRRLQQYLAASCDLDAAQPGLAVLPARGWFIVGFLGLIPAVLVQHTGPGALAIAIGGILQAYAAFATLGTTAGTIISSLIAWRQLAELYHAAAELPAPGNAAVALQPRAANAASNCAAEPVLDMHGVSFRYRPEAESVLQDCSLSLHEGDRVLLEGPSGGGKSTLAALLVGLRSPQAGHILLRGLDRTTLGAAAWRRRVASAPQFHENHILSGSLAFNLLMGRQWPPSDADRHDAETLCRELGLGPTLDRMPSRLNQIIGESGWQLSHGERSRVFLARALLQRADVVILDESFGALDPLTLQTCMQTVRERSGALLVIAHP